MTKYMKEKDGNRVIRYRGEGYLLEYYDRNKKIWVEDFELCRMFFGDLPVENITEQEANKLIKQ